MFDPIEAVKKVIEDVKGLVAEMQDVRRDVRRLKKIVGAVRGALADDAEDDA